MYAESMEVAPQQVERPASGLARTSTRITFQKRDFERTLGGHGYKLGFPRYDHALKYGRGRTTLLHWKSCMERVKRFEETEDGQRRPRVAAACIDRWTAEVGEATIDGGEKVQGRY